MRIYFLNRLERDAGHCDEIMHNPDVGLPYNRKFKMQQVIVIFMYRTMQGILDRNGGRIRFSGRYSLKHFVKALAWDDFDLLPQQLAGGLLAESSQFSLKSYAHPDCTCHRFIFRPIVSHLPLEFRANPAPCLRCDPPDPAPSQDYYRSLE